MLLIYHEEQAWNRHSEAERQQIYGEYRQLIQEPPVQQAISRGGPYCSRRQPQVPFAYAMVSDCDRFGPKAGNARADRGYFMIDASDLAEATNIAGRIPLPDWAR